ncbi:hypothetical protein [Allomuricauda sp. SCSIO 65647]|uniref:hypothetical protein n=1 Tax=Allomuricauda sp. SCSIO 65647 TaxID=2908843 RepID=UPI001F2DC763|nr:hypothetical protein [Muricauda sp. SCSIO 65647]UJH68917.1 hypothetical protein L0P89_06795 [Muricauda sp. SCSIO 65647]
MTQQEFYINVGYLANPERRTNIEVEMPHRRQASFIAEYATLTGNFPLPPNSNIAPYYVWVLGTDKYGLETRAYFTSNANIPQSLIDTLEPRGFQNRPGYDVYDRRISRKKNIFPLLEAGFVLGPIQDVNRIRRLVPAAHINDFHAGFAL